jgi:hypothetical protein
VAGRCPIDEAIPSTAVFDRRIRSDRLIEVGVIIVGVPDDDAVLGPSSQRLFMYSKAVRHFLFRQHSSISKSLVAWAKPITVDQVSDT